jgi:O-antigen/teichoic acid export membrane protein
MQDYFNTDHTTADLKARALKGAGITLFFQTCNFGIGTIGTVVLARLLTPHDFGLVTMVLVFSLLLQNFGANGFIDATIQSRTIDERQISTFFWINVGSNSLLMLAFIGMAPVMAALYGEPALKPISIAISASILLSSLPIQHQAILLRKMEFFKVSLGDLVGTGASTILAISLAYHGWGYWALVSKWVTAPLCTTISAWTLCRWRPGLPARGTGVGPMVKFALHAYGNFVVNYSRRAIDKILVGSFRGTQDLGNYDRAYQLSNMLPNQLVGPLNSVAMTTLSKLSDNPERYRQVFLSILSTLAFVCMPLSAILTLTGKDFIILLLGSKWTIAGELFCYFGVSVGIGMVYSTHSWLHLSLGTPKRLFFWGLTASVTTIVCFVAGAPFGTKGVAIAYSASLWILVGPGLWYAGKRVQLSLPSIVSAVSRSLLSALVAGLICWFLFYSYGPTSRLFQGSSILFRILLSIVIYMCFYLIAIVAMHRSTKPIVQFISIAREMIPKYTSSI